MTESKPDQGGQQWPGASAWPQDGQAAWPDPGQSAWPQAGQPAWPDPNQEQPGQGVEHQAQGPQGWPGAPGAWSAQPQGQQDPRAAHGGHQPAWDQDAAGQQGRTGQVPQPSPYAFPGQPQPAQDPSHAYPQQGYDPSQGYPQQGGWDQQQAYDPNQAYHQQGYPQQGYDPSQGYPQQGGWDQQQAYDPNQAYHQQGYPQQGYDPSQRYPQQGGWDQQQAYDPNQAYHQQGHDPVHQGGWDQQQGYDPSQQGGWDQQPEAPRGGEFQGFDQSGGFGPEFNTGVWQHDDFDPMSPSVDNLNLISSPGNRGPGIGRRLRDAFGRQGPRDDLQYRTLVNRINQPIQGDYRIAILSLKGGVGKTTTTVGLGSTFASLRGDRVIAVDANPDLGTLGSRIPRQSNSTVRDLLVDTSIYRYSDVRAHTSQSSSRLEVLASERDPAISEAFSERDYRGVIKILQRFYNVILTDCGTGLMHSAMKGVLDLAHALVLVTSPALDGARSAGATLDWLLHHGYDQLVARTVVVVSSSRPGSPTLDLNQLRQHFLVRCRAVQIIPFDDHLSEGAEIELDQLHRSTRRSFVELAALIADDFPMAMSRQQRSQY